MKSGLVMTFVHICLGKRSLPLHPTSIHSHVHDTRSSENDLGTSTSDVDICLKTTWPNLELSTLAAALRKRK